MKADNKPDFDKLKALYINCTLKKTPRISHTKGLMDVSMNIMKKEKVTVEYIRFVEYDIPYGVQPDMKGHGWDKDDWPKIFDKIMDADILIIGSPIWLGEKSAVATKLIERMYGMSGQTNDKGQYIYYGKVGGCIITGNEDGAKHCSMGILYSLQHLGYSIPPQADCGWLGKIGPGPSYLDEDSDSAGHDFTNRNTTFMTYNILHLAKLLKENNGYSNYGNSREEWDKDQRWNFTRPDHDN